MKNLGVALDLGTSGLRGQAIDLDTGQIIKTVITARHPLPGANVMDHLTYAIEVGLDSAHHILIDAVNQVLTALGDISPNVVRLAVCGNPIQLSLFEGIEVRDLAYAGKRKKQAMGIIEPNRDGKLLLARDIEGLNLPATAEVVIPPAVEHEIGADALAMMLKSGMLERKEIALVTDYGTNAEMALRVRGQIITGSCAAGPALEGQHIRSGMLAGPGAISDLNPKGEHYAVSVLNSAMLTETVVETDLLTGITRRLTKGSIKGITGTGVISLIDLALNNGYVQLPGIKTKDHLIHLTDNVRFSEQDLGEAGKAIGAIRAGYIALCKAAGIEVDQIEVAYMAGASGTYVDALKAQRIGLVPPTVKKIYQIGNTSLALARDLVFQPQELEELKKLAVNLRATHCMFGDYEPFSQAYLLELSYWDEGMPRDLYLRFCRNYGLSPLPKFTKEAEVLKWHERDIPDLGAEGLMVIEKVGLERHQAFPGCTGCGTCTSQCLEEALSLESDKGENVLVLRLDLCNGTACLKCVRACPEKVYNFAAIGLNKI
ncbi:methylamine methyltransferase corrinoid protein reductive activase [Desulfosporosinus sp. BICA1-9]|uniref:methylamine methyltransferase corrinoid protein reductive activase n=1 Tax=Desulfosporosinus sp. BICA1-9 TaxID=1531958 RepID=UPI00054C41A5|nr:methylamine methyltransferase corrinoid protein reductive activase [Desulfosporosinus sp. BICA1-9]KJS47451.1 MAG: 4Fe-4S ferredoxin [Peptococcaceae bacterium BRH_c23]KJS89055.1 MAG: 4Fe-4S ferredoxin [Desulfosporosinus sp. BICA1-9]HBW36718.1 methylamine methyltransferase corrinoid protein reductive activase [Desulfosporosinus sp.]